MKIEIIAGSARKGSLSKRVALHLFEILASHAQLEVGIIDMQDHHLPPVYNPWQGSEDAPRHLRNIATRVFDADAFVLVSPEYNGSYSPALKNFLDHFPKRERKVFGIVTSSPGNFGGMRAAVQLQNLIFGLCGIGVPRMLIAPEVDKKFSESGDLLDPTFAADVNAFIKEFVWLSTAVSDTVPRGRLAVNGFPLTHKLHRVIGFQ